MKQATLALNSSIEIRGITLAVAERPQERMEQFGVTALSDAELIATVLQGSGMKAERALSLATRLIAEAGSMPALAKWSSQDFQRQKGIGRSKGLQLAAVAEIGRRMIKCSYTEEPVLNRADLIAAYLEPIAAALEVEKFWVLCLNRKNRLIRRVEISSGTATAALAHPREVFRAAIRESASGVVCAHNHPSGDPAPSAPDLQITRQLRDAARAVDIELLDHVIIGRVGADPLGRGYFSFREAGLL